MVRLDRRRDYSQPLRCEGCGVEFVSWRARRVCFGCAKERRRVYAREWARAKRLVDKSRG